MKIRIKTNNHEYAIWGYSGYGPSFGYDIRIANNANTTLSSWSNLGWAYSHPQYAHGTNEAKTFLAGSYPFKLVEIELIGRESILTIYNLRTTIHNTTNTMEHNNLNFPLKEKRIKEKRTKIVVLTKRKRSNVQL